MKSQRLIALDLTRGMSVLMMVCVHTLWMYGSHATQTASVIGDIVHMIGKGTASFLLTMGISLLLSSRQSALALFYRGLTVLALGYGMNFLKFVLPIMLNVMPDNFIAAYGWQSPLSFAQVRYLVMTGDILQMAGFALVLLALVQRISTNQYFYLALAVIIATLSQELRGWQPNIEGLDYLADVFFSKDFNIYFPIFPWFSCVLVGMFMGRRYLTHQSKARLYRECLTFGLVFLLLGLSLCLWNYACHFSDFFHLGPGGISYLIGLNLIAIWLANWLISHMDLTRVMPLITYCSQHVTTLYITQWVIVCWGMTIVGYQRLSPIETCMLMPLMIAIVLAIHYAVFRLVNRQKASLC
ncbi:MAG: DUF1624 domain-containing protein [Alteromonadaceae bacterium]|nr:DUF1624 domain-containing protein [Alteromonadaceae bacterium]